MILIGGSCVLGLLRAPRALRWHGALPGATHPCMYARDSGILSCVSVSDSVWMGPNPGYLSIPPQTQMVLPSSDGPNVLKRGPRRLKRGEGLLYQKLLFERDIS